MGKASFINVVEAIIILILAGILISIKKDEIFDGKIFSKSNNKVEKYIKQKYPVIFKQPSESSPAKTILIHIPSIEVLMGSMHPAAALYQGVTSAESIAEAFERLKDYFYQNNISVITIREALKKDKNKLKELAKKALIYQRGDMQPPEDSQHKEKYESYLSDNYKNDVINELTEDQLVDLIITKPTYKLDYTSKNTYVSSNLLSFNPLNNLVFCRDQQITTSKGVVIGHLSSPQREEENDLLEAVFENIGSKPIGRVKGKNAYLEGGDFFVARNDLSMCGVGLRTTIEGASYLMENDLLGTRYMGIIYDDSDLDQDRMHLDTYFNILNDEFVIALDFNDVPNKKNINRKVFLYDNNIEKSTINSGDAKIKNIYGKYKLIEKYNDFYQFLNVKNFKVIKVTNQQQYDYMINFLNIGNNKILSVHKDLANIVKNGGCKEVQVDYIDFGAIQKMYGAAHCSTQVSRALN